MCDLLNDVYWDATFIQITRAHTILTHKKIVILCGLLKNSNNARVVFEHVKITSLKYNLPIRVVTILTILFIQYHIIIGYNNVETKVL